MPTGRLIEEHPTPVEALGQTAAQGWPDDRADHDARAPHRHRLPRLFARVDVQKEGLRQRHDGRAKHALQQAEQPPSKAGSTPAPQAIEVMTKPAIEIRKNSRLPMRSEIQPVAGVMIAEATI